MQHTAKSGRTARVSVCRWHVTCCGANLTSLKQLVFCACVSARTALLCCVVGCWLVCMHSSRSASVLLMYLHLWASKHHAKHAVRVTARDCEGHAPSAQSDPCNGWCNVWCTLVNLLCSQWAAMQLCVHLQRPTTPTQACQWIWVDIHCSNADQKGCPGCLRSSTSTQLLEKMNCMGCCLAGIRTGHTPGLRGKHDVTSRSM